MTTKVCSKCGEEKDTGDFHKNRSCPDGYKYWCKQCIKNYYIEHRDKISERNKKYRFENREKLSERQKIHYSKNKDYIIERNSKYYIEHKEQVSEYKKKYRLENTEKISARKKIEYLANKDKYLNYQKIYRSENKEMLSEYHRNYIKSPTGRITSTRKSHNRRARLLQTPCTLTIRQWNKILEHQGNKCAICGKIFCNSRPATKDHIIPLSRGGGLTFENVQALCKRCNSKKNSNLDLNNIVSWGIYDDNTP